MQPTAYTLYRPDGSEEAGIAELDANPGYFALVEVMRPLLDGRNLERVRVLVDGQYRDLFVAERGEGLPRNEKATALYRANYLTAFPKTDPESLPAVYGPAVLFSRPVWF